MEDFLKTHNFTGVCSHVTVVSHHGAADHRKHVSHMNNGFISRWKGGERQGLSEIHLQMYAWASDLQIGPTNGFQPSSKTHSILTQLSMDWPIT